MLLPTIATTILATQTATPIQIGKRADAASIRFTPKRAGSAVSALSIKDVGAFLSANPSSGAPSTSVDEGFVLSGSAPVVVNRAILSIHGMVEPYIDGTASILIEGKTASEDPEWCHLILYLKPKTAYLVVVNGTPSGKKPANLTLTDETLDQTLTSQLVPKSGHAAFVLSPSPGGNRTLWISTDTPTGYVSISSIQIHEFK